LAATLGCTGRTGYELLATNGDQPAGDAPDASVLCQGLLGGVHVGTRVNNDARIELDGSQLTGVFTSTVCDGTLPTQWHTLGIRPLAPYDKELSGQSETDYSQGNLDATGLVGLWHFNEASVFDSDTLVDSSGNSNDGNLSSQDAQDKATGGVFQSGLHFDGIDDFVSFGTSAGLTDLARFSMVAWVSPDKPGPGVYLLAKGDVSAGWTTYIDSLYGIGMSRRNPGVYTQRVSDPTTLVPSEWQHVAVTWAGTTGAVSIHVYRQAIEPGYAESVDGSPLSSDAGISLRFGAMYNNTGRYAGQIDEVAIYNRVLSAGEILDIYKRGALRLRFQVRSCDDLACDTEKFVGPDSTEGSYYSELMNNTSSPPVFNLTNIPDNRYFQWRAFLETDDAAYSPELTDVVVAGRTVH
jgi:hypothetical protein